MSSSSVPDAPLFYANAQPLRDTLAGELRRQNLRVALAHVHAPVGDMLRRARVAARTGGFPEFLTLESAVRWASSGTVPGQRAGQGPGASAARQGGGSM